MESANVTIGRVPWNKGKLTGQKPPLKLREIWAIRTRLQMASNIRELAMFNLAIDSKLRACDLTRLQVQDVRHGSHVAARATVMQQKTQRPVQFEITEQTRESLESWIEARGLKAADFLFPSRLIRRRIYRRGSTPGWCTAGSHRLVSTIPHMAPTLCVVQKLR
jgi:integrase